MSEQIKTMVVAGAQDPEPHTITFSVGEPGQEVLKLAENGAWVYGEKVDDNRSIYAAFKAWLNRATSL